MKRIWLIAFILMISLSACATLTQNVTTHPTMGAKTATPTSTPTPTATPTLTPTPIATSYPTPDLSKRPQVWFEPYPPVQRDQYANIIGSKDYFDLFDQNAPWQQALSHIQVLGLYSELIDKSSDAELKKIFAFTNQHGIALSMQMGPLLSIPNCGQNTEGFDAPGIGVTRAMRIKQNGGVLSYVDMDEPYYFGSLYDGPSACHWSAETVAKFVGEYIREMKSVFPNLKVGDVEPLANGITVTDIENWVTAFKKVNGYDLPFFHLDITFSIKTWPQDTLTLEKFFRNLNIDFGLIYIGNGNSLSDEDWISVAGERIKTYEDIYGGQPTHIVFESWYERPDKVLPETQPYTYTWLIDQYFENRQNLGFRTSGAGINLAYLKKASASKFVPENPPLAVVDDDPDTNWIAGDFAPQWIQIDLGQAESISEIKLLVAQNPDGNTIHRILTKGPGQNDPFIEVHRFDGFTRERDMLDYVFATPLDNVRYVRVETLKSPSWVAWYEIQVIAAR